MAMESGVEAPRLSQEICEIAERLDGLGEEIESLSDDDLIAAAVSVERLGRLADGLRTRASGEVAHRSRRGIEDPLAGRRGCRNATELLERLTGASGRAIRARVRLDENIRTRRALTGEELPPAFEHVASAYGAGLLGDEAAAGIAKAVDAARHGGGEPEKCDLMERHLVAIATGAVDPDGDSSAHADPLAASGAVPPLSVVTVHAQAWLDILTADGIEPDHERLVQKRALTVTERPDGSFAVNGILVPEAGALLQLLLSAHTSPARNVRFAPSAGDEDEPGHEDAASDSDGANGDESSDGPRTAMSVDEANDDDPRDANGDDAFKAASDFLDPAAAADPRSPAQKRHDALMAMLEAASRAAETPRIGGAAPTVMIHVAATDLDDASAHGVPDDARPSGRRVARIDGASQPVPVDVAQRIACTGGIERVRFDAEGRILGLDSVQRCFTPTQRRAIVARDGGCIIPGCTIPAAWCEIHHVDEHSRGGPTRTDNGVLLCWWHHHHLDRSGWDIQMHDGVPYVTPPRWIDRDCRPRPATGSATRLRASLRRRLVSRRT